MALIDKFDFKMPQAYILVDYSDPGGLIQYGYDNGPYGEKTIQGTHNSGGLLPESEYRILTDLPTGNLIYVHHHQSGGRKYSYKFYDLTGTGFEVMVDLPTLGYTDTGAWHWIGVKALLNGGYDVRVDGEQVASAASGTAIAEWASMRFWGKFHIANLIISDDQGGRLNGFLFDERRLSTQTGIQAGYYAQFTPSTGENWENVDDAVVDDDTTFNSSSTTGHKDSFVFSTPPTISGMKPEMTALDVYAKKTDCEETQLRTFQRSGVIDTVIEPNRLYPNWKRFTNVMGHMELSELTDIELGYEVYRS